MHLCGDHYLYLFDNSALPHSPLIVVFLKHSAAKRKQRDQRSDVKLSTMVGTSRKFCCCWYGKPSSSLAEMQEVVNALGADVYVVHVCNIFHQQRLSIATATSLDQLGCMRPPLAQLPYFWHVLNMFFERHDPTALQFAEPCQPELHTTHCLALASDLLFHCGRSGP